MSVHIVIAEHRQRDNLRADVAGIALEKLTKVYADGTRAVDELDLEIADGEFVVFVGPSGCGKTSALRMIAGLEDITAGSVRVGGEVVNGLPPKARDMAMIFQNYALYPHMNVFDNMAFGLKMRGHRQGRDPAARGRRGAHPRARRRCSGSGRGTSPAASGSASRWAARSCGSRRRSSWTSRSRTSTRSCACRCAPRSPASSATSGDDDLRHARPERGDDPRRPRLRACGAGCSSRSTAAGALRPAGEPVRRRLHRLAGDEPRRGGARERGRRPRRAVRAARPGRPAASSSPSGRHSAATSAGAIALGIRPEDLEDAGAAFVPDDARLGRRGGHQGGHGLGGVPPLRGRCAAGARPRRCGRSSARRRSRPRTSRPTITGARSSPASARGTQAQEGAEARLAVTTRLLHFFDLETGEGIYGGAA